MDLGTLASGAVIVTPCLPVLAILVLLDDEFDLNTLADLLLALKVNQIVFDSLFYLKMSVSELAVVSEPALSNHVDGTILYLEHVLTEKEFPIHRFKRCGMTWRHVRGSHPGRHVRSSHPGRHVRGSHPGRRVVR